MQKQGGKINDAGDVNIEKCTPQELMQLGKALDADIGELTRSYGQLIRAQQKFEESKMVIDGVTERAKNEEIMVPLTSSLYVAGELEETEKVLVEVGAQYFIEMPMDKAKGYCDRKIGLMTESSKKVGEVVQIKKMQQNKVSTEYAKRVESVKKAQ
jgi:prefoldin alpha subunit